MRRGERVGGVRRLKSAAYWADNQILLKNPGDFIKI